MSKTPKEDKQTDKPNGAASPAIDDIWQNYDAVLKDAVTMFKDKSLDFFGLPKEITVTEPLKTETKEIEVKSEFADLTFKLSNGKGLHLESEAALSVEDMFRFCRYHINLIQTYGFDFTTVILVKDAHNIKSLDYKMLKFTPLIVNCREYDGDSILAKLKEQVEKGEEINELEVIYLPLFGSEKYTVVELLMESLHLINASNMEERQKLKVSALTLVLSNKIVDKDVLEELWRRIKMMGVKILDYAIEQTMKEGLEKGREQGEKRGLEKGEKIGKVKLLLEDGFTKEKIAEKLKLPVREVEEIIDQINKN